MNPHQNNQQQQQPYYNYQQHVPGPPQPPWQHSGPPPAAAWNDPRFQNGGQHTPQPSSQYGQNTFGPPSQYPRPPSSAPLPQSAPRPQDSYPKPATPQFDSAQWGVRYNQNQHSQYPPEIQHSLQPEQKPILPPRPVSSLGSSVSQSPPLGPYQSNQPQYPLQGSWKLPFNQIQDQPPPTPPPRPAAYTAQSQHGLVPGPQEQYSHHPPTHHYDPQPQPPPPPPPQVPDQYSQHPPTHHYEPQPQGPAPMQWQQPHMQGQTQQYQQHPQQPQPYTQTSAAWNQSQHSTDTPVSPLDDDRRRNSLNRRPVPAYVNTEPPSQNVQMPPPSARVSNPSTTSTFMGGFGGGPSDWQHYQPVDQSGIEDEPEALSSMNTPPEKIIASPLQAKMSIRRKSIERIRPASKPVSPYQQPSPSKMATPGKTTQRSEYDRPVHPPERHDSGLSTVSSMSGIESSENIDNVIQAWSAPLTGDASIQAPSPPTTRPQSHKESQPLSSKAAVLSRETQTDFQPMVETRVETRVETKEVEVDPYADIQNEYKATLKRFADMLRQEALAKNDEEKFNIFQGFVIRELRLRSVLYGVETAPQNPAPKPVVAPEESTKETKRSVTDSQGSNRSEGQPNESIQIQSPKKEKMPVLEIPTPPSPISNGHAYSARGDGDDVSEYSPGGRPRMPLRLKTPQPTDAAQTSGTAQRPLSSNRALETGNTSPGANAPMVLDDYITENQSSPSANAPMVVGLDSMPVGTVNTPLAGQLNFQPSRPVYQPFRYGDGPSDQIPTVQIHPPTESFAELRQNQATESGRTLISDGPPANIDSGPNRDHTRTPSAGRKEHEEAFIGLIRARSQAIRKDANASPRPESPAILRAGTPAARSSPSPAPVPPLVKSVQSLRALVPRLIPPQSGWKTNPHPKLEPIASALQKLPNDFGFIHARVIEWDKTNRQVRARQDAERQTRQSEYEEHNDHLFNENQIGYAEIAESEKRFRLDEANKKYKEDQAELDSFTHTVFDYVVDRIDDEINQLNQLQTQTVDMLDLESVGAPKQIQRMVGQSATDGNSIASVPVTAVMQAGLDIHDQLEIRYMKIAEASFERERRRKRLELSVLYTNSDKVGIKKLEAEFAKAEKLQVLEEFRKKSERANRLLDRFDRAVVRGLAENQGAMDDMLTRLQLLRDLLLGSDENGPSGLSREELLYGPDGLRDIIDRTSAMIDFVWTDSRTLVQLLDKADVLSNNADFDLYMAEARLADASPDKFKKLQSEKEAEDGKVEAELTSRLGGIARAPNEILVLIKEVRDKIGGDAGHGERIGKALEAAKRRNFSISS